MAAPDPLRHTYLLALGSNVPHHRHGRPHQVLDAAIAALRDEGLAIEAIAPAIVSLPLGPSRRSYANGAALVASGLEPPAMLALLKRIERRFGRRRGGQRWGSRVLDLDIVLWSGGSFAARNLLIPHPALRQRSFVLGPAQAIVPRWRDPVSGLTMRQLHSRLTRRGRLPKRAPWSGP